MEKSMKQLRVILIGFGNVNRTLCEIIFSKQKVLQQRENKKITIVGACDSSGGLYSEKGLDLQTLINHKSSGLRFDTLKKTNDQISVADGLELAEKFDYDILIEGSPCDLETGGIGLKCVKAAIKRSKKLVLANKAPLVLKYDEIETLVKANGSEMLFSATVCGGLPVVNVGRRDLKCAKISKVYGVFNGTSNFILSEISKGKTSDEAMSEAQRRGIAEANPALDVEGWDAANKLVIIANSVLRVKPAVKLADLKIEGIQKISLEMMNEAKKRRKVIRLVACGKLDVSNGKYSFKVGPEEVEENSFLGRTENTDKCCVFESDLFETTLLKTDENGVVPTAAAVLRDILNLN